MAPHGNRRIGETDEQLAMRWIDGETLEKIAADHGVTREAVRLHVKRHLARFGVTPQAVKAMHAEDRERGRRLRQQEADYHELMRRMAAGRRCVICPCFVLRSDGRVTCSEECAQLMRTSARYWNDEERHEAHRRQVAASVLRRPDKYSRSVEWAKRVLSDDPPEPNRRYVAPHNRDVARQLGVTAIGREAQPTIPCAATNMDGSSCKRFVKNQGDICHIHAGMQLATFDEDVA